MNLDNIRNDSQKILNCKVQDSQGLNDFQKVPDHSAIAIDRVGIEQFHFPLSLKHSDGTVMGHDATANMFVFLKAGKTGVNMSRFCAILQEEAQSNLFCQDFINTVLSRFRYELRDFTHEGPIAQSFLDVKFRYPLKQQSLASDNWGWQYYDVGYEGVDSGEKASFFLTIKYQYSSICPCSLSLAKQYEEDFREGKATKGEGIAAAHGQRSTATVRAEYNGKNPIGVEELVGLLRTAIPTETQSMVKRADEKAFAILSGLHPIFVEHAARRISLALDQEERILDWQAKIEHFEGLHGHNAVAFIEKESSRQNPLDTSS